MWAEAVSSRYEARRSEHGWGWGVWDTFDNRWMVENRMKNAADEGAAWLNKRQHPARPPKAAEVWLDGEWVLARLVHWSHEPDGSWLGRAIVNGQAAAGWYPADRLRPMKRKPSNDDATA